MAGDKTGSVVTAGLWTLLIALVATLFSVGVIWFMQVLEYPLFAHVGEEAFPNFHAQHNRRLPGVVFAPMLIAFAATLALLFVRPNVVPGWLVRLGVVLIGVVLVSSFTLLIPRHMRLTSEGHSLEIIRELVRFNWIRTVAWTLHALVLLAMLVLTLNLQAVEAI